MRKKLTQEITEKKYHEKGKPRDKYAGQYVLKSRNHKSEEKSTKKK